MHEDGIYTGRNIYMEDIYIKGYAHKRDKRMEETYTRRDIHMKRHVHSNIHMEGHTHKETYTRKNMYMEEKYIQKEIYTEGHTYKKTNKETYNTHKRHE